MQKTYCRLRFPDINHGPYLTNYFENSAQVFDPPSKKSSDEITKLNKSQRLSMIKYKIAFDVIEISLIKVTIFAVSWCLKLLAFWLISRSVRTKNINKLKCYYIAFSQKLHMISLNTVALDLIPYSLRALFQTSSQLSTLTRVFSGVLTSLLVYDFCEIYHLGGQAEIKAFESESSSG
jgi:hypothetical protein